MPWIDDAAVAGAVRGTFLGDYRVVRQRAACAVWDVPPRELRYARADADVPVLFIAGERDYVTPVAWAERVAGRFARGRLVTVPGLGHFPAGLANMGCLDALLLGDRIAVMGGLRTEADFVVGNEIHLVSVGLDDGDLLAHNLTREPTDRLDPSKVPPRDVAPPVAP